MRDRFVHIGRLTIAAKSRKPGIVEAYMKVGKIVTIRGQQFVQVTDADYQAIKKEFAMPKPILVGRDSVEPSKPRASAPRFKLPTIGSMAKAAVSAAGRVITAAATNLPVSVSDAEFQRRMAICTACEFLDNTTQRCGKCGCFVAAQVIGKARLATETCPIDKWAKKEL